MSELGIGANTSTATPLGTSSPDNQLPLASANETQLAIAQVSDAFELSTATGQAEFIRACQELGIALPDFVAEAGPDISAMSTTQLAQLSSYASDLAALVRGGQLLTGAPATTALTERWGQFVAAQSQDGNVDVNSLVQQVLRESYLESTADLYFFADKVKFYNGVKKQIRSELQRAREVLAQYAGQSPEARLVPPFEPAEVSLDYFGPSATAAAAAAAANPALLPEAEIDLDGDGAIDFLMPPELYSMAGVQEAIEFRASSLSQSDIYATHKSCRTNRHNPGNLASAPHLKLMIYELMISEGQKDGGRPNAFQPADLQTRLQEKYGISANLINVDTDDGDSLVALQFDDGSIFADGAGDGMLDSDDYDFAGAVANVQEQYGVSFEQFGEAAPEFINASMEAMEAGTDPGEGFPQEQIREMFALAYILAGDSGVNTKAKLDAYIDQMEETLNTVGDDAQLANVDLQNMLQKQQQTLQSMSNISKMLHDTAMATIRKLG